MPRTIVEEKTVFTFDELSDSAKERARTRWRELATNDEWWGATYDDATQCAAILGIEIANWPRNNPKAYPEPAIWFSGFWSQGDGACFEGTWSWKACGAAMRQHAGQDKELHRIADVLTALPHGEGWSVRMKHRGHYYHSGCMDVDVSFDDAWYSEAHDGAELAQADFTAGEETVTQAMRDFADWIYSQLEKEHEWQNADEQVDANIRANEYEFLEDGRRA